MVQKSLKRNILKILLLFIAFGFLSSCAKEVKNDVIVYENDFESGNLTNITEAEIVTFNGSKVLGRYNNGGFTLQVNELPKHDLVEISFDLYIHDSWDGNKIGDLVINGPDIWKMLVENTEYISTTFSNVDCGTGVCNPQSYPFTYPNNNNNPKTGAFRKDLPGVCLYDGLVGGTTLYKIVKQVRHSKSTLILQCLDKLVQSQTNDPRCDESWSVDNIKIKAINL